MSLIFVLRGGRQQRERIYLLIVGSILKAEDFATKLDAQWPHVDGLRAPSCAMVASCLPRSCARSRESLALVVASSQPSVVAIFRSGTADTKSRTHGDIDDCQIHTPATQARSDNELGQDRSQEGETETIQNFPVSRL